MSSEEYMARILVKRFAFLSVLWLTSLSFYRLPPQQARAMATGYAQQNADVDRDLAGRMLSANGTFMKASGLTMPEVTAGLMPQVTCATLWRSLVRLRSSLSQYQWVTSACELSPNSRMNSKHFAYWRRLLDIEWDCALKWTLIRPVCLRLAGCFSKSSMLSWQLSARNTRRIAFQFDWSLASRPPARGLFDSANCIVWDWPRSEQKAIVSAWSNVVTSRRNVECS